MLTGLFVWPDLHAWYTTPGEPGERRAEWLAAAEEALAVARASSARLGLLIGLFPGDLFVSAHPSAQQLTDVARVVEAYPGPAFVLAGNHDLLGTGDRTAAELATLWTMDVDGVLDTPRGHPAAWRAYRQQPKVDWIRQADELWHVLSMPYLRGMTDDVLDAILRGLVAESLLMPDGDAARRVLLAHWGTDASTYASGDSATGREPVLRMASLQSLPLDLVALGHIHVPGVLGRTVRDGPIFHAGALTLRDFGEGGVVPSVWTFSPIERRVSFVEEATASGEVRAQSAHGRELIEFPLRSPARFTTIEGADAEQWAVEVTPVTEDADEPPREFLRVRVGDASPETIASVRDAIAALGPAVTLSQIVVDVERTDRLRAEDVDELTDPRHALARWLEVMQVPEQERAAVLDAARSVFREEGPE